MIEKLEIIKQRFNEVSDLIIQPDIISDQKKYIKLNKEYKDLSQIVSKREKYLNLLSNISEAEAIIKNESDSEMIEMAKIQLDESKEMLSPLEDEIKHFLKSVISKKKPLTDGNYARNVMKVIESIEKKII